MRTITALAENTTAMRAQVYRKARLAVDRQLRSMNPRPSESMIDGQMAKLEAAFLAIENGTFAEAQKIQEPIRLSGDMRRASSSSLLTCLLPLSIVDDFFANLSEIYEERWLPLHGEQRAKWRWHRECISMIARCWFDLCIANARRWAK